MKTTEEIKAIRKAILKALVKDVTTIRLPAHDTFSRVAMVDDKITARYSYATKDYLQIAIWYNGRLKNFRKYPILSLKQDDAGNWYINLNVSPEGAWSMNRDGTDNHADKTYPAPTPLTPPASWTNPTNYDNLELTCTLEVV
jgi:hypothetical protein